MTTTNPPSTPPLDVNSEVAATRRRAMPAMKPNAAGGDTGGPRHAGAAKPPAAANGTWVTERLWATPLSQLTLTSLCLVLLAGCWRGPEVGEEHQLSLSPDGGRVMGFSELVDEVFTPSCATSFCHKPDPPPAAPMSLETAKAYDDLVGVTSSQAPSFERVVPGDPANSWLVIKMRASTAADHGTTRMPLNKPELSEELIEQVEAWIARGAPND